MLSTHRRDGGRKNETFSVLVHVPTHLSVYFLRVCFLELEFLDVELLYFNSSGHILQNQSSEWLFLLAL